ncbi:hypothetical protein D3C81_1731560 [compost metagenome]
MKDVRQLVGPRIHLGIAQALIAIHNERTLGKALRLLFQAIGKGVAVSRLDPCESLAPSIEDGLRLLAGHWPADHARHQARLSEIVHPYLR